MRLPHPGPPSDSQWHSIQPLIPLVKSGGRPRTLDMSLVVNAILYLVVGGHSMADAPQGISQMAKRVLLFSAVVRSAQGAPDLATHPQLRAKGQ